MSTSALAPRLNRQLLRAIGDALDGVKTAICIFDDEDRTVFWNRSFLQVFPEHAGKCTRVNLIAKIYIGFIWLV